MEAREIGKFPGGWQRFFLAKRKVSWRGRLLDGDRCQKIRLARRRLSELASKSKA
jgi:hypothetical protein